MTNALHPRHEGQLARASELEISAEIAHRKPQAQALLVAIHVWQRKSRHVIVQKQRDVHAGALQQFVRGRQTWVALDDLKLPIAGVAFEFHIAEAAIMDAFKESQS